MVGSFGGKYGIKYDGIGEIQCAYVKDASKLKSHIISWFRFKIFLQGQIFKALALVDDILEIPRDHFLEVVDGNLIKVSIVTLMAKENACMLEPRAVNERLDPQHGEVNAKFSYNNPLCW